MQAVYKQLGDSIDYTPEADVAAGDIVQLGYMIGIAKLDIKAGELGSLALTGVFEVPKKEVPINAGSPVYWDPAAGDATNTFSVGSTDCPYLGYAIADAASDDDTVRFLLYPSVYNIFHVAAD